MSNRPIEMLEKEHKIIQRMVNVMEKMAEALETDRELGLESIPDIVDFMRTFADHLHHGKEEALLFPLLESRGVPVQGCPLGALRHEHVEGRALVGELARTAEELKQGKVEAQDELLAIVQNLIALYPNHIWKEDYLLFPMTQKVLSEADLENLQAKFEEVDEIFGKDLQEQYQQLVDRLEGIAV